MGRILRSVLSESERIAEAKAKGYEGFACLGCGSFTLVKNGKGYKCDTCSTRYDESMAQLPGKADPTIIEKQPDEFIFPTGRR